MSQLSLTLDAGQNLLPGDGEAFLHTDAIPAGRALWMYERLMEEVDWRQEQVTVMGRTLAAPRLTAWYGTTGYVYSGVRHEASPPPPEVVAIQGVAEAVAGHAFNAVLLNLYRDGSDSVSWHADNEAGLGRNPVIASVTLGERRKFQLKHRRSGQRLDLMLENGSILVMGGAIQHHWLHQIPKTRQFKAPRINLTFRSMLDSTSQERFSGSPQD